MITGKIDLAKITGAKIVAGKSGNTTYLDITKAKLFKGRTGTDGHTPYYLDVAMIDTKQTSFGDWRDENTHMIVEASSKEDRAANKRGAILGNAQDRSKRRTNDQSPADPASRPEVPGAGSPIDPDDVPF